MRALLAGFVFLASSGLTAAQPGAHSDADGKYRVKFPGAPRLSTKDANTAVGDLQVAVAVYANSDGGVLMVSYTDFPESATKPANHGTLFDGIRDGVKGGGKLVSDEKNLTYGPDKLPFREFVVEKDRKQRIRCRVILRDNRVYQLAVIGTAEFVGGKEATAFLESFELTK